MSRVPDPRQAVGLGPVSKSLRDGSSRRAEEPDAPSVPFLSLPCPNKGTDLQSLFFGGVGADLPSRRRRRPPRRTPGSRQATPAASTAPPPPPPPPYRRRKHTGAHVIAASTAAPPHRSAPYPHCPFGDSKAARPLSRETAQSRGRTAARPHSGETAQRTSRETAQRRGTQRCGT